MKEEGYGETKSRSDISYCRNAVAYIWSNMFTMGLYTYRIRESIHIREIIIIDTRNPVYDTRKKQCLKQDLWKIIPAYESKY